MYYGDYHTHTGASDGHGTVEDVIKAARERGLKELAITDHGFANPSVYSLNWQKFCDQRTQVEAAIAAGLADGMTVYHGIEADIINERGDLDLTEKELDTMQFLVAGFHSMARTRIKDWCGFYAPIFWGGAFGSSQTTVKRNTKAAIAAIKRYPIDVWAHANYLMHLDVVELAKAAADYGTKLECNMKHLGHFDYNASHDLFEKVLATGVGLIADTDAHQPYRVGNFQKVEAYLKQHGLTPAIFENYDRLPVFPRKGERSGQMPEA